MFFFFQAEDVIRVLVRSRGLGDVNERQEARIMLAVVIGPEVPIVSPSITEPEVAFASQ